MDSKTLERAKYIEECLSDIDSCISDGRLEFGGFYYSYAFGCGGYVYYTFPKECRSEIIEILKKWQVKLENELENL